MSRLHIPKRAAAAIAIVGAAVAGVVVCSSLLNLATWGGPNGTTMHVSDLPVGLLLVFLVVVVVVVAMVAKVLYELLVRR